jgi:hypothetical protein
MKQPAMLAQCKVPTQKPRLSKGVVRFGKCVDPAVTQVIAFKSANIPGLLQVRAGQSVTVCARHASIIKRGRFA